MLLRQIVIQKPCCKEMPLPPSPLGLSAYDALDLEDEISDPYVEDEEDFGIDRSNGIDKVSAIYSDFNIMNPVSSEGDEDDWGFLDALDGIQPEDLPDMPPAPPSEESIVDLLREKDRQGDGYFVRVMV